MFGWKVCPSAYKQLNSELLFLLFLQKQIAHIIQQVGLPESTDLMAGLKEGSYWYTISTRYLSGEALETTFVKAVYNLLIRLMDLEFIFPL